MPSPANQKSLRAYLIGFGLSLILSLVAFALIEYPFLSHPLLYVCLAGLAILQLYVQCICFLGLNFSSEGRWNMLPFLFSLLIIAILAGGTLWIMYNLNYNMMN